uniref:glycosyltransferase n=1 Tax=Geomonas edaphica TaxID=2570226 RepID=UPI0010A8A841
MIIGIDASNIRAGGGVTHLIELLRAADPQVHGFSKIVVWSGLATLNRIDDRPWLVKNHQRMLDKSLPYRAFWQCFKLSTLARLARCDVLFVPGGSYAGNFHPMVALSQNLLPFEWRELARFGRSLMSLKLFLLRISQGRSFKQADGLIFLTCYARDVVMQVIKTSRGKTTIVSHGIDSRFSYPPREQLAMNQYSMVKPFRILYVSIIDMYKHQWHVAEAVASLRKAGVHLEIDFIGPAYGPALEHLLEAVQKNDPNGEFLHYRGAVPFEELHTAYRQADACVFASSCENLPNILLEAMAAGLPIACSNRGPMPEVLGEAGAYFDPEQPDEIAEALRTLFNQPNLRKKLADLAFATAQEYSWERCAEETFSFIAQVAAGSKHTKSQLEG